MAKIEKKTEERIRIEISEIDIETALINYFELSENVVFRWDHVVPSGVLEDKRVINDLKSSN